MLLSEVDAIAAGEWLWPTVLPDDFDFQYANRNNNPSGDLKSVQFGATGSLAGQFGLWVGPDAPSDDGRTVEVAGRDWTITSSAGQARGTTAVGDRYVDIGGPVSETALIAVIDGLALVSEAQLPSTPLSYEDVMTDVGEFDINGEQVVMSVDESNGWFCTGTRSSTDGGGGCVTYFDPAQTISRYHASSVGLIESTSQLQMSTRGMASTDVARIDVEFINGATSSVVPQNTSGQFPGVRFWTVGAVVDVEPGQDPDAVNVVFVEIRAYDANGTLLATRTSDDDIVRL